MAKGYEVHPDYQNLSSQLSKHAHKLDASEWGLILEILDDAQKNVIDSSPGSRALLAHAGFLYEKLQAGGTEVK